MSSENNCMLLRANMMILMMEISSFDRSVYGTSLPNDGVFLRVGSVFHCSKICSPIYLILDTKAQPLV